MAVPPRDQPQPSSPRPHPAPKECAAHIWDSPVVSGPVPSPGAGLVTPTSHPLHGITHYCSLLSPSPRFNSGGGLALGTGGLAQECRWALVGLSGSWVLSPEVHLEEAPTSPPGLCPEWGGGGSGQDPLYAMIPGVFCSAPVSALPQSRFRAGGDPENDHGASFGGCLSCQL